MQQRMVYFFIGVMILFLIGCLEDGLLQLNLVHFLIFLIVLFIAGHAVEEHKKFHFTQLTRVEVRELYPKSENEFLILEETDFDTIREALEKVEWKPNRMVDIQGERAIITTFFYTFEEDRTEALSFYEFFLMKEGSISLRSGKEKEGYGELSKEHAESLKYLLF
ncbi:hypothetical protein [Domibacillus robiginosus]|uniref:hypothetical protein n=1 Tax=Domibacillus robiginosus TaxID=1071054 RepID=UPI00067D19C0|nr:hypothetical protein [Domibacillus robiginosus]